MKNLSRAFIVILLLIPVFALAQEKIDINTATIEDLQTITGIGPVYAQKIIDERPFSSLNDLTRIEGIGEKTLQKIKDQGLAYITEEHLIIEETEEETPQPVIQTYPENIIFTEIVPSPEGPDDKNEWIEIYNNNEFEADLSDWIIKDSLGRTTEYILSAKVPAFSYLTLKRPETKITLNNSGDKLLLLNPNKEIIDSVEFGKAVQGESYVKTDSGWTWTTSLTPEKENIIAEIAPENPSVNKKADLNKTIPLNQSSKENVFLTAFIVALLSGIAFLIIKHNLKAFWY